MDNCVQIAAVFISSSASAVLKLHSQGHLTAQSYWMRKYRSAEWQQYLPLPLTLTLVKFETFIFETKGRLQHLIKRGLLNRKKY